MVFDGLFRAVCTVGGVGDRHIVHDKCENGKPGGSARAGGQPGNAIPSTPARPGLAPKRLFENTKPTRLTAKSSRTDGEQISGLP